MGLFSIKANQDKDLQERRQIMQPPDPEDFEEGFTWRTAVGAIFLGFLLTPATQYLQLVVGNVGGMNQAARWMTIVLFAEIGRRSLNDLKTQECYILFMMSGLLLQAPNNFQGLLWNQYFARSDIAHSMGIAQEIPHWWAPQKEVIESAGRTFFTWAWVPSILVTSYAFALTRLDNYTLGYVMYRITSDVERLPFPMAPVNASGITALANASDPNQRWRWRIFSIGGMLGFVFGTVYIAIPAVSGALLAESIQLIPIPWVDFTPEIGTILPATPFNIQFDLGIFILGMVMPFWAVLGGVFGLLTLFVLCPILYHQGILTTWEPGMDVVNTMYVNNVDFFLPFQIGTMVALVIVSFSTAFKGIIPALMQRRQDRASQQLPPISERFKEGFRKFSTSRSDRGDWSVFWALGLYALTSTGWIGFGELLIPGFPSWIFILVAVFYIPMIAYTSAKVEGLAAQGVSIPMAREASFILSGYEGVAIWFIPMPTFNHGMTTKEFRVMELTGTKFKSVALTFALVLVILVISEVLFSQMLWFIADVPSEAYPFAQEMWEMQALNQSLMFSATQEGGSMFARAWNMEYFMWGTGISIFLFGFLNIIGIPTLLIIGFIRTMGLGQPGAVLFELTGALVGRYYFRRKFGEQWNKYPPVLMAGFACGMGLIGMVAVAFTIMQSLMTPLLY